MATEQEKIADLTKNLIEIPSITGKAAEAKRVFNLVDAYLGGEAGIVSKTFRGKNDADGKVYESRIWGDPKSLLTPELLLCGHIDVVDVAEDKSYLFAPIPNQGILMGRGAADMKGGVAAILTAFKRRLEVDGAAAGVSLVLTSDEEHGGFGGIGNLIANEDLKPKVVFIPDGEGANFDIVDSQKAPHHFKVVAKGPGGHASRAFEIDNPINRVIKVYSEMQKKYALATVDDAWKSTFEMTVIQSLEKAKNQIPSEVSAWFSWRWPIEQIRFEQGRKDMLAVCKKYRVELTEEEGFGAACKIDNKNAPYVQIWKAIIEKEIGKSVEYKNMHGATDGRHFYDAGIRQVLVTAPISGGAHANNEWVNIDSLVQLAKAVYNYQQEIAI